MHRQAVVTLIIILLLNITSIFGGAAATLAQTVNVSEPTQVFSGDDVASLGVSRLNDLVSHMDEARLLSMDGFGMRFSLGGIGSFQERPPEVFVDGHPVEFGLIGSGDLVGIGIPVEGIDRVEVYARPTLISGVFAGQGAIHIFTKQADEIVEVRGRAGVSHVDAMPGAAIYDDGARTTSPVDGLDLQAAALGEVGRGSLLGSIAHRRYAHDDRNSDRLRALSRATSPFTALTWSDQRFHLSVLGLGTAADRFAHAPYASRVLATDVRGAAASAMVTHGVVERGFLRHRATINLGRTHHEGDPGYWHEDSFSWMSALLRTLEERIVILGGTADLRRVRGGQEHSATRWGSVFAAIAGRVARGTDYRGGGAVAVDGRSVAVKAYGGITFDRWERHRADIYIAVVDGLLYDQNAADYWARGELAPPLYPLEAERPLEDVTIKATFDAGWRWRPTSATELRAGAGIRRSQKIYLPVHRVRPAVGGGNRDAIQFDYTSGTQGTLWGEFTTHVLPGRQRVFFNAQRTIVGDEAYDEAWDAVPDLRAGISLTTPIIGGFRFSGVAVRETGKIWTAYEAVPTIPSELSGNTLVSAHVSKRLFSGVMHVSLGLQNLLGEAAISHPMGDALGRSVRVDIVVDLVRRR